MGLTSPNSMGGTRKLGRRKYLRALINRQGFYADKIGSLGLLSAIRLYAALPMVLRPNNPTYPYLRRRPLERQLSYGQTERCASGSSGDAGLRCRPGDNDRQGQQRPLGTDELRLQHLARSVGIDVHPSAPSQRACATSRNGRIYIAVSHQGTHHHERHAFSSALWLERSGDAGRTARSSVGASARAARCLCPSRLGRARRLRQQSGGDRDRPGTVLARSSADHRIGTRCCG